MSESLFAVLLLAGAVIWVGSILQKALDRIHERLDAIEERLGIADEDDAISP